jgi:cobalt/nickel-transporting P-type ATPase D
MLLQVLLAHAGFWVCYKTFRRTRSPPSDAEIPNHPFLHEIYRLYHAIPALKSDATPPGDLDASPFFWVDTPEGLAFAVDKLSKASRVAIDTEHHSQHTYSGITCLLQLSCVDGGTGRVVDFVIDAVKLRLDIHLLAPVLECSAILKVVHGGGGDLTWLLRDFGLRVVNVFDTEKACQVLGWQKRSLAYLLARYCGIVANKAQMQREDWRQRPLSDAHIRYARTDVHWLLYIADCLGQELLLPPEKMLFRRQQEHQASATQAVERIVSGMQLPSSLEPHSSLGRAVQRSQELSLCEVAPIPSPDSAAAAAATVIMRSHVSEIRQRTSVLGPFPQQKIAELRTLAANVLALCLWRDVQARKLDEGVQCVLPDEYLLSLAQTRPETREELHNVFHDAESTCNIFPRTVLGDASAVLSTIRKRDAAEDDDEDEDALPGLSALLQPPGFVTELARKRHEDPAAFAQRLGERFGVKKTPYENCKMYSMNGQLLCYTDKKRLQWYVRKGLATVVQEEPLSVQLTFQHRDDDQRAGRHHFYSTARENRCVGCGEKGHFLRYRVVPQAYRRALPAHYKSHRSHDVLLLCVSCHEIAQHAVEKMKQEIAEEFGVPLNPPLPEVTVVVSNRAEGNQGGCDETMQQRLSHLAVRKAALALQDRRHELPPKRRVELESIVRTYVWEIETWLADVSHDEANTARFNVSWVEGTHAQTEVGIDGQNGSELHDSNVVDNALTHSELLAGLLAGMGPAARKKSIRRWAKAGADIPQPLLAELDDFTLEEKPLDGVEVPEACSDASDVARNIDAAAIAAKAAGQDARRKMGHEWHGQMVVEKALARGGDQALNELLVRFRRVFVDALCPTHLPVGWSIEHVAPRSFGAHSVYGKE